MESVRIFEELAEEYDKWFDRHQFAYESELEALRRLIPQEAGKGLEIGVGTGRFAIPLGIRIGLEPAKAMAKIARERGIQVLDGRAESLPFEDASFELILMVNTICFLQNPLQSLREATRVLKPDGHIVIGIIDRVSPLGRMYEAGKKDNQFYRNAFFYSARKVIRWLRLLEYRKIKTCQTIFKHPEEITALEPVKEGYGEGGFVAISARKKNH